jgi:pyridoxamine 5'-phosphate oxidase
MDFPTELLSDPLPREPLQVATTWLDQAWKLRNQPNPNAMVLATVSPQGYPSARVVLCKSIAPEPGYVTFYTNYQSRKGQELEVHPRAAIVMHWDHLHRQVRIEGTVVRVPAEDSDAYFASRPWQSRIGAWASAQSQPVASRAELHKAVADVSQRFGVPTPDKAESISVKEVDVPRPPHWGGYRLWVEAIELWVEGEARIHDRARWTRTLNPKGDGSFEPGPWSATRLQP